MEQAIISWLVYQFSFLAGIIFVAHAVTFTSFRMYSRGVYNSNTVDEKKIYRLTQANFVLQIIVAAAGVGIVFLAMPLVFYVLSAVTTITNHAIPSFVAYIATFGILLAVYFGLLLVGVLGYAPYLSRIRDTDNTTWPVVKNMLVKHGILWLFLLLAIGAMAVAPVWGVVFGVPVAFLAYYASQPYVIAALGYGEPISDDFRQRLGRYADEELPFRNVKVIDASDEEVANVHVAGFIPGHQDLLVTNYLLEELPPAEIEAVVAYGIGFANRNKIAQHGSFVIPFFLFSIFLMWNVFSLGISLLLFGAYIFIVHAHICKRTIFAADTYAAEQTSAETTQQMLRNIAALNTMPEQSGRIFQRLTLRPTVEQRIERLEEY